MPSAHATRMNDAARPRLWARHAETVVLTKYVDGAAVTSDLRGVPKRVRAEGKDAPDGIGVTGYTGEMVFTVMVADMPTSPGPEAFLTRNGEQWQIRHIEPQDEWTNILHLARPDVNDRKVRG